METPKWPSREGKDIAEVAVLRKGTMNTSEGEADTLGGNRYY